MEFLMISKALPVANIANVLAHTILPESASPAAAPYRFCSAIPHVKEAIRISLAKFRCHSRLGKVCIHHYQLRILFSQFDESLAICLSRCHSLLH